MSRFQLNIMYPLAHPSHGLRERLGSVLILGSVPSLGVLAALVDPVSVIGQ